MNLIRVGKRTLNLDYLIESSEDDPAPGSVCVHLVAGRAMKLSGREADEFVRILATFTLESQPRHTQGKRARRRPDPE